MIRGKSSIILGLAVVSFLTICLCDVQARTDKKQQDIEALQQRFHWWPNDSLPEPVKDETKGGYWWWPTKPGSQKPWGNRGYIYVHKIIFDYQEDELPPAQPEELRPSLLLKRIHRNTKIYFDYDSAQLRPDAEKILLDAVRILRKNPETDILITGNCDIRGSEVYNERLGKDRGTAVKNFMLNQSIAQQRIRVVSRGKLDAAAPVRDLVGMQKDRNAQFMVAEVEEVMIPYAGSPDMAQAQAIGENKYIIEEEEQVESKIKVSMRGYTIKKTDTLWKIAQEQLGSGHRWKYLYEMNKEAIVDPNKLKAGTVISIPLERGEQYSDGQDFGLDGGSLDFQDPEDYYTQAGQVTSDSVMEPLSDQTTQIYTIKKGDSLWKIARDQLGDGNRWKDIYNANKSVIRDPNKLKAGQKITIYK